MKKLFFPSLVLVSMMGLVACGNSDNGLVKDGKAFKDGETAKVSEEVKVATNGKVKSVTQKTTTTQTTKTSAGGKTETTKQSGSSTIKYNFETKTIEGKLSQSGQSLSFKAAQQADGSFEYVTGGAAIRESMTPETLTLLYEAVQVNIYSWNYESDASSILSSLGGSIGEIDASSMESLVELNNSLISKMVISGDTTKGTFDVGIAEQFTLNLNLGSLLGDSNSEIGSILSLLGNIPLNVYKMKQSYKDGLLRSNVTAVKTEISLMGNTVASDYSNTATFTYEMAK